MENIKSAVFTKNEWMKAYSWQSDRIAEGYDNIFSLYANGKTVKIASKSPIARLEGVKMSEELLNSI
jgi:hypothetical protein